ncbi:DUF6776 family protein [Hydrogenophaga sp. 5NK40-0174]|uniref:DUF6776 family protein n=1 Tax=Hydrogenophaga sp. 5NK40-0174 TaxID=3127649 RepID=UPI00310597A7
MRLRLMRRRLTASTPRVAIRSATSWPVRMLLLAVVLGFSSALAIWAFEFGKEIAGLEPNVQEELERLRDEVSTLSTDLTEAKLVADTSGSLLTAEKAAQEQLLVRIKQLEADNQALRNDLGFFERLIPANGSSALSIRGLQVDRMSGSQLKWQVLMIQPLKNAPDFHGELEISFTGSMDGKPWSKGHSSDSQRVTVNRYLRLEGLVDVPTNAVVKTVTAKILQNGTVKSVQTIKL